MPQFDYEIGEAKERDPNQTSEFSPLPRAEYKCIVIDTKVKDTKAEIITDPATTIPNSRNNLPVNPCKKMMGRNTTASVMEVEMTAK